MANTIKFFGKTKVVDDGTDVKFYANGQLFATVNHATGDLLLEQTAGVGTTAFFVMSSNNSNGAGVTPAGTLQVKVNGTTYYLLTSAAA